MRLINLGKRISFITLLFFLFASGSNTLAQYISPEKVVLQMYDAFNAHDGEAMVALSHEDITWYSVNGKDITIYSQGADPMRTEMVGFFSQHKGVYSELNGLAVNGPFVSVVERAFWLENDNLKTLSATAVYEVRDGRVLNVWYFPDQP